MKKKNFSLYILFKMISDTKQDTCQDISQIDNICRKYGFYDIDYHQILQRLSYDMENPRKIIGNDKYVLKIINAEKMIDYVENPNEDIIKFTTDIHNKINLLNITAKIHEYFFSTQIFSSNKYLYSFTIMDRYDTDLGYYITDDDIDDKHKKMAIKNAIKVLRKMTLNNGIYCADVKPTNFVLNKWDLSVKIIDFDYGSTRIDNKNKKNNYITSLFHMLLFKHVFQYFLEFNNSFICVLNKNLVEIIDDLLKNKHYICDIFDDYFNDNYSSYCFKHYHKIYNTKELQQYVYEQCRLLVEENKK